MHQFYSHLYIIVQTTLDILCKSVIFNGLCIIFFAAIYIIIHLNICTSKTPTLSADLSDKGNSYHALEKCKGVNSKSVNYTDRIQTIDKDVLFSAKNQFLYDVEVPYHLSFTNFDFDIDSIIILIQQVIVVVSLLYFKLIFLAELHRKYYMKK